MEQASRLNEAFQNFTEASKSLESYYVKLNSRVQHLTNELGRKNAQLRDAILKLGESKDYLQAVLQSIGEAIIVLDQDERVTMINRAAEELLCIVPERGRGALFSDLEFDMEENSSGTILAVKDKRYDVIISRSAVTDHRQKVRGYVILIKDISRLKELERQDERNLRLISMGEMAAKIVHEIRSPLCSIELFATMLSNDLKDTPHSEMADGISTGIKSLNNILTNMLYFAKPQKPVFSAINIKASVEDSLAMMNPLIDARGINLSINLSDMTVAGDPELLKQVFINIIQNAVQAMPDGGELNVSCWTNDEFAIVSIVDEGVGISSENIEKIFDPFFSTKEKGTGLGLAITHKIIQSHDGFIRAVDNEGKGSTFSLYFPVKEVMGRKEAERLLCIARK